MYQSSYQIDIGNIFMQQKIDMNRKDTLKIVHTKEIVNQFDF